MNLIAVASSLRLRSAHNCFARVAFNGLKAVVLVALLGTASLGYSQDSNVVTDQTQPAPVMATHILRPSSVPPSAMQLRTAEEPRVLATTNQGPPVNTGSGIVYTCDPNVAAATCNYLNTTVASYYNSIFTNANANIYVEYGTTGLGQSQAYYNYITYAQYLTALNALPSKSAIQTSAISALNTYDATPYGGGYVVLTAALQTALGYPGATGATATLGACTAGTSGCYNGIITVINDPQDYGFSLYYDNLGGSEPTNAYDFYAVVEHETDELLGTTSCISTGGASLSDGCNFLGAGTPSVGDLFRYSAPGDLVLDSSLSTTAGAYFSYDGGTTNGANGVAGTPKVFNTLSNGNDYADYISSSPCSTDQAIQDAEGCPGKDAGLTILNDGGSEVNILTAVGFSVPTPITVSLSATSLSFPSTKVGSASASQSVTMTNTGTEAVTISSIAVTGTNASSFGFANDCGASLAVGASCMIHGHFAPAVGGALTASITITDNASGSPQSIALSGTGLAPAVTLTATSLSFASTKVGSASASQSVTMTNSGNGALSITSITVTGTNASSFLFATTCGASLAAGANCTIHGHFAPTTGGALMAAITITDNASGSPQSIALSGTGLAPAVTLTATSLSFPSTKVGSSSSSQSVTMTNSGNATLTISSIAMTGANASSFVFANGCGASLTAGASCTIHGHFSPTATGALTAAVTITDNASGSPQSIALSGTGR